MSVRNSRSVSPVKGASHPNPLQDIHHKLNQAPSTEVGKVLFVGASGKLNLVDSKRAVKDGESGRSQPRPEVEKVARDLFSYLDDIEAQARKSPEKRRAVRESASVIRTLVQKNSGVTYTPELKKAVDHLIDLNNSENGEDPARRNDSPSRLRAKRRERSGKENTAPKAGGERSAEKPADKSPGVAKAAVVPPAVAAPPKGPSPLPMDSASFNQRVASYNNFFNTFNRVNSAVGLASSKMVARRKQLLAADDQGRAALSRNLEQDVADAGKLNQFLTPGKPATKDQERALLQFVEASAKASNMDAGALLRHLLINTAVSAYLNESTFTTLVHMHHEEMMKLVPAPL